jgi:hypothetical protein
MDMFNATSIENCIHSQRCDLHGLSAIRKSKFKSKALDITDSDPSKDPPWSRSVYYPSGEGLRSRTLINKGNANP